MTDRTPIPHEAPRNGDDAAGTAPQRPGSSSRGGATRKAIPARVMVAVAIAQAYNATDCQGVQCPLCGIPLHPSAPRILEHMTPHATRVALGLDPDAIDNLAWVHKVCADKKTNGTKATTAGSDKHMIAKGERLAVARLAKSEVEKRVTKERWRWKKKIGGGVVRVRTR